MLDFKSNLSSQANQGGTVNFNYFFDGLWPDLDTNRRPTAWEADMLSHHNAIQSVK